MCILTRLKKLDETSNPDRLNCPEAHELFLPGVDNSIDKIDTYETDWLFNIERIYMEGYFEKGALF